MIPAVWRLTEGVCTILAPTYVLMAVIYTAMAVVDAQARPLMSALAFIVGAWGVSVPMAWVFCVRDGPRAAGNMECVVFGVHCGGYRVECGVFGE